MQILFISVVIARNVPYYAQVASSVQRQQTFISVPLETEDLPQTANETIRNSEIQAQLTSLASLISLRFQINPTKKSSTNVTKNSCYKAVPP